MLTQAAEVDGEIGCQKIPETLNVKNDTAQDANIFHGFESSTNMPNEIVLPL